MIVKLRKPFDYESYHLKEINLDLERLRGTDMNRATKELLQMEHMAPVKALDDIYCGLLASYAANIPFVVLQRLPMCDYAAIVDKVSGFLLGTGSEGVKTPDESSKETPSA